MHVCVDAENTISLRRVLFQRPLMKAAGKRLNEEVTLVISVKAIHVYRTEMCK